MNFNDDFKTSKISVGHSCGRFIEVAGFPRLNISNDSNCFLVEHRATAFMSPIKLFCLSLGT